MKLYDMTHAPNPRRVRIFLAEKGVEIEKVEVDVMGGENLQSAFLAINPRGVVPALQIEDGTVIDESSAICRYFEETHPEPSLFGHDAKSKAMIESWIRKIETDAYYPATDVLRNGNPAFENRSVPGTNNTAQVPALIERGRTRVKVFYRQLDKHLRGSKFIAGEEFSAADITALCTVDFAEQYIEFTIPAELNSLAEWHSRVSVRPSAQA